jgi:hypothetical protein
MWYFGHRARLLNLAKAKCRQFGLLQPLLYMTACDMCWNFILTTQLRKIWREFFRIRQVLGKFLYILFTHESKSSSENLKWRLALLGLNI